MATAIRTFTMGPDGLPVAVYYDEDTGKQVNPSANYDEIVDDPSNEDILQNFRDQGNGNMSAHFNPNNNPSASNNFGYHQRGMMEKMASMLPGPLGLAGKGYNAVVGAQNANAVNKAREYLGLEPGGVGSILKGAIKDNKGYVADVGFAGNPNTYAVGLGGVDGNKRAVLTPDEARKRSLLAGGLTEATAKEKKQNLKDFKTDKKAQLEQVPAGPLDVTGVQDGRSDKIGQAAMKSIKGAQSPQSLAYHGLGLADFAPSTDPDLPTRDMAKVNYDLAGKGRSEIPTSGIGSKVSDVVTDMLGPGYTVNVTSGMEPEGHSAVGTKYRHPLGTAADLDIRDPQGRQLSLSNPQDRMAIKDVAQGMAARYNANFGMGNEYMGANTMHIDTMDLSKYPGGAQWASMGKNWATDLDQARATGVMPSRYYDIANAPTPQERPPGGFTDPLQSPQVAAEDYGDRQVGGMPQERKPSALPSYDAAMSQTTVNPNRFSNLSKEERGLMGQTLAGEIDRSKTDLSTEEGQREAQGILSSIENRVSKYGSVKDAIQAPAQYSTWNNPAAANTAKSNYAADQKTFDGIVDRYVSDPSQNLGFTSYHAATVNPSWSSKMENATTIGPHVFGSLPEYGGAKPNNGVEAKTVFNQASTYAAAERGVMSPENANRTSTTSSKPATSFASNSTSPSANASGTGSSMASKSTNDHSYSSSGSNRSTGLMSSMSSAASKTSTSTKSTDKDKNNQGGWGQRSY